jgi:ABC-type antimicrobial peptide transport system permease subunit
MVIGTLALGIGSVTAVFGMASQLVLRPLPGTVNSDRAAYLQIVSDRYEGLTLAEFDELARSATLLEDIASYRFMELNASVNGARPISVLAGAFYGDFFEVLGVQDPEGRVLSGAESALDANPLVAVISASLRDRLFGDAGDAIGHTLQMDGQAVEIVGVAPRGFQGPERGLVLDAWLPFGALVALGGLTRDQLLGPDATVLSDLIVLPRPGATLPAVEAQVAQILARLAEAVPESAEHLSSIRPVAYAGLNTPPVVRAVTRRTLGMMTWAVLLILAIACANVANLLLFQNLARRGALATARALGASTGRIARQHLMESLGLGLAGGTAGLGARGSSGFAHAAVGSSRHRVVIGLG